MIKYYCFILINNTILVPFTLYYQAAIMLNKPITEIQKIFISQCFVGLVQQEFYKYFI